MKKRSFVFGFAALLGAALIFAGCQQDAESGGTTYVTKTVGKVTQSVEGLQALLNDDDVTEVNYEDGDLVIKIGTTLNIPAGKTLNVSSGGVKVGAAGVFAVVGTLNLQPNMTITVETGGILIGRKEGPDDLTNLLADPDTPVVGIYTSISGAAEAHESGGEAAVLDVSVAELNNSAFEGTLYVLGTITITDTDPAPGTDLTVMALGKIIFNVPSGATVDISKLADVGGALLKSATPIKVMLPANGYVGAIEAGASIELLATSLTVKGPANFSGITIFGSSTGFNGIVTFSGPVSFNATAIFNADADFKNTAYLSGASTFHKNVTFSDVTTLGPNGKIQILESGKLDVQYATFNVSGMVSVGSNAIIVLPKGESIGPTSGPDPEESILSFLFVPKAAIESDGLGGAVSYQGSGSIQLTWGAKGQYGNTTFIDNAGNTSNYFNWGTGGTLTLSGTIGTGNSAVNVTEVSSGEVSVATSNVQVNRPLVITGTLSVPTGTALTLKGGELKVNGTLSVYGTLGVAELATLDLTSNGFLSVGSTAAITWAPDSTFVADGTYEQSGNGGTLAVDGPFKVKNLDKYTYFVVNEKGKLTVGTEATAGPVPVYGGTTVTVSNGGSLEINGPGLDFGTLGGTLKTYGNNGVIIVGNNAKLVVTDTIVSTWRGNVTNEGTISYTAKHVGSLSSVIEKIDGLNFDENGKGIVNVILDSSLYTDAAFDAGTIALKNAQDSKNKPRIVISGTDSTYSGGTLGVGLWIARDNVTLDRVHFDVTGSLSQTFAYRTTGDKTWYSLVFVNANNVIIQNSNIIFNANDDGSEAGTTLVNVAVAVAGTVGKADITGTEIKGSSISVITAGSTAAHGLAIQFGTSATATATVQRNFISGSRSAEFDEGTLSSFYLDAPVSALLVGNIPNGFNQGFTDNSLNGHNYDFYLYPTGTITTLNFGSGATTFYKNTHAQGIGHLFNSLVSTSKFSNGAGGFGVILDKSGGWNVWKRENYKLYVNTNTIENVSYWNDAGTWGSVNAAGNTPGLGFHINRGTTSAPDSTNAAAGSAATSP